MDGLNRFVTDRNERINSRHWRATPGILRPLVMPSVVWFTSVFIG